MSIKEKTPVHIGLFGHIDSGKTKIASVLSEIISTAGIDAHPQSKERGITIDLGFTSFMLDKYLVTLVDGPGHADLIKISASSVEIIDCALLVIDINKGPQVQTGEHLIMIETLNIEKVIVILNKTVYAVSAKNKVGFEELKSGIFGIITSLKLKRNFEGETVIPIDHHFSIKGRGAVVTGTILQGKLTLNQNLEILPVNTSGRVKNIQIFHQDVDSAKAGDRVGINLKNIDVKKIYRGCYATSSKTAFDYGDMFDVEVINNKIFKPNTHFGTQVHITIGMYTAVGNIYPYYELEGKRIETVASSKDQGFKAIILLKENVLIRKEKTIMLLSRLDLPPTTLRILGSGKLLQILNQPPLFYKYKIKTGRIKNPNHSQGIVCSGLAQSAEGAKKIIGRKLEPPFTKILGTFGTKGAVIVGIESSEVEIRKSDPVILKELRNFRLKKI
ncbi:MAG: GTP-binding protein [Promethearchaeota archaeon]